MYKRPLLRHIIAFSDDEVTWLTQTGILTTQSCIYHGFKSLDCCQLARHPRQKSSECPVYLILYTDIRNGVIEISNKRHEMILTLISFLDAAILCYKKRNVLQSN